MHRVLEFNELLNILNLTLKKEKKQEKIMTKIEKL